MANELTPILAYNNNSLKYIKEVNYFENNIKKTSEEHPETHPINIIMGTGYSYNTVVPKASKEKLANENKRQIKRLRQISGKLFSQYYFDKKHDTSCLKQLTEMIEPINFYNITYTKLKRFISIDSEILNFKIKRYKKQQCIIVNCKVEVIYYSIRDEIISYIEQDIENLKKEYSENFEQIIIELKKLFSEIKKNNMSYDDYLNKKTEELLQLNIDEYLKTFR